tara:strand:+ start:285 stop:788 length:504 start_codon:yes stop_codon:yes gene_type:complete
MHKLTKPFSYLFNFLGRIVKVPFQLSLLSVCLYLGACSHFEQHHHSDEAMTSDHITTDKDLKVELNGDNKWLMDAHTRSAASDMLNRFSSLDLEQQSQQQLTQLGEQLSQDLGKLIQGCTMEGDAHNALHDFLTSFMPALEELKTTADVGSAKHVKHLLTEYQLYFE